jgi:glycosyltransferase involved in cell wall biosynthesis
MVRTSYDVVLISQPYAYLVYERLTAKYPQTCFLNVTHGWEDHLNAARLRFAWDGPYSRARRLGIAVTQVLVNRACQRTVHACHGIIAASQTGATYIQRRYGVVSDKIAVIPIGLDDAFLGHGRGRTGSEHGARLLYVGNYLALKGSHVLESVLPPLGVAYPHASMTFVVPIDVAPRITARFGPAFGRRLTVLPWRARQTMPEVYAQHDILVFPSLFEGFGRTFLEAMACGACVVGFGEGGLPDVATSGLDAFYCRTGDVTSMTGLMERCLQDPDLVRQVGERARLTAQHYSLARSAELTEAFCEERRHASTGISDG